MKWKVGRSCFRYREHADAYVAGFPGGERYDICETAGTLVQRGVTTYANMRSPELAKSVAPYFRPMKAN